MPTAQPPKFDLASN